MANLNDFIGEEREAPVPEKLPTFQKWVHSAKGVELKKAYLVRVIWKPNKFKNFTLDTECFRLRIPQTDPLYEALHDFIAQGQYDDPGITIKVTDPAKKSYILGAEKRKGFTWDDIGTSGIKYTDE